MQRAKTVAVYSGSGGIGKTLVASNLAVSLHQQESGRVLFIDAGHPRTVTLDQFGRVSFGLYSYIDVQARGGSLRGDGLALAAATICWMVCEAIGWPH